MGCVSLSDRSRYRRSVRTLRVGARVADPHHSVLAPTGQENPLELSMLLVAVWWVVGWALCFRVPRLPPATSSAGSPGPVAPQISVVVPARDEAHALPTLLAGLARQTRAPAEVVVVDDDSTDGTGAVARAGGARVVMPAAVPDGWTGKAWACDRGVAAATGEVLVFLDADTDPGPELLERVEAERARTGGLVSVQPYHRMRRPYERLSAFFNLIAMMGTGIASVRPGARTIGAFGPCIAIDRATYTRVGGHAAGRADVLDDVSLATRARDSGTPVDCFGGRGLVELRMYPGGVRSLAEGWSKNFAAGAVTTPIVRLLLIVGWFGACLGTGYSGVRVLADVLTGGSPAGVDALIYLAFALQLWWMWRALGNFTVISALLYPLLALGFVLVFAGSVVLAARGAVRWKGRTVRTSPAPPDRPKRVG
jgi:4,4'-diaponeurosporenoate glycosyltransferase